jgi:thiamine transporter
MIAIAFVLSMLRVVDMPFGGSVTAFGMLPLVIIAYRYKIKWGLLAGLTFSALKLVMGLRNLSYATSATAGVAIILLDYIVAFTIIGLAGVLRGKVKDHGTALAGGALIACTARYACHVIVGCTVWAGVSIPSTDGLIFSMAYNASYMVPETLLTVIGAYFAGKAFTLTEPRVKRVPMERSSLINIYTAIPVSLGTVISFIMLFGMMQTKEGFDITAVANADIYRWITLAAVFAVGILSGLILRISLKQSIVSEPADIEIQ